jgi:predicted membrane channel-forming protein YqfA (hemolysin III family)
VTTAEIEEIIMLVCVTGLVGYMGYIVVDLAKRSGAGKLGMYILLGVLMLAPAVFILKELAVLLIDL